MQQPSLTKQLKEQSEILLAEKKSNQNLREKVSSLEEVLKGESLYLQELQRRLHQEKSGLMASLRKQEEEECELRQREVEELKEKVAQAERHASNQSDEILRYQQSILSLEREKEALQRELNDREKTLFREIAFLKETNQKETGELHEQLKKKSEEKEKELLILNDELKELKVKTSEELLAYQLREETLNQQLREKEEELRELSKRAEEQEELLPYKERFLAIEVRERQLKEELEKSKSSLFEKTQALDSHFHRVSELSLELKNVREQSQRTHLQIEQLHSELRIAQQHLAKKLKEITDLRAQLDRERIEKSSALERAEQLTRRAEEAIQESEKKEAHFRMESADKEKRVASLEKELAFAAKELTKKSDAVERLTDEVEKLRGYEAQLTQIRSLFGAPVPKVETPTPKVREEVIKKEEETLLFAGSSPSRIRSSLFEE